MPRFDEVRRHHVLAALVEYDECGADVFLVNYGFRHAHEYVLWHEGRSYDSKAILGVAHKYATGVPAASTVFSGGKNGAAKTLRALGFDVTAADDEPGTRRSSARSSDGGSLARGRAKGDEPAPRAVTTCPTCHLVLPAIGLCDNCD
ncbi:hypothetical protein [Nocardioides salarius]|uniref:hypothetical protein n=1 Tax=Nocardioides salarius TaxID=374513 RepID=UPI0030FB6CB1